MNIEKIKACAEAARHQEWDWLCESDSFDIEHTAHIANCDPDVILKMIAVIKAARSLKDCKDREGTYIFDKIFMELEDAFAALEGEQ